MADDEEEERSIETDEDAANGAAVMRTQQMNGGEFNFKCMYVYFGMIRASCFVDSTDAVT